MYYIELHTLNIVLRMVNGYAIVNPSLSYLGLWKVFWWMAYAILRAIYMDVDGYL